MLSLTNMGVRIAKYAQDNAPAILTAVGVVGAVSAAYLTGKGTVKAIRLIEQEEAARGYDFEGGEHLTPLEKVQTTWQCYIPAAGTVVLTVIAIVASNRVSSRRATSVATALAIGEKAFSEYKDKVIEKFGEGKERTVRDDIAQDHVRNSPPDDRIVIITDGGHVLCRDEYSGRYFKSSVEEIRRAENDINKRIIQEGDVSLTDFYELIGLPRTSHSDDLGWNTDEFLEINFSTATTPDGKPCICFTFEVAPFPAFFKKR